MSKIYALIEDQVASMVLNMNVNSVLGLSLGTFVKAVTTVIYVGVLLVFGVYLWNHGLQPLFPGLVAKINNSDPNQMANEYGQLLLTLIALMMLF